MVKAPDAMGSAGKEVWILGGGRFGRQAAEVLQKKVPGAAITVVDKEVIAGLPGNIDFVQAEAVEWLVEHLAGDSAGIKIVPAIPVHLIAEWLKRKISSAGSVVESVEIADELLKNFPNPYRLSPSQLAVSHADFLCPPTCVEPEDVCTYTREPRPAPLYEVLQKQPCGKFTPVIIRSHQFGGGVGGYYPDDFRQLHERVVLLPKIPLLIGTACKCHGIVDGLLVT
jgi:hypothetical protein